MSATYTVEQVAQHNKEDDAWIIIDGEVYDITKFMKMHPGGKGVLFEYAGKDATTVFFSLHKALVLAKYKRLVIGKLEGAKPSILGDQLVPGAISKVPFGEPNFWQGFKSPYYNDSHVRFRKAVRAFFDKEFVPTAEILTKAEKPVSDAFYKKAGEAGILASFMGPGPWLKGFNLPGGVTAEEFDYFHEQIAHEEKNRCGFPGLQDSIAVGQVIGLPPVTLFAKPHLREKITREVLTGEKKICLAISEPYAGSDVAGIQCRAELTPDGKHYIVNGVKKWITNGTFSDYFTTAVQTGGPGMKGMSLLLIERGPGVETKTIKTSYAASAGTSYITFENVKVPVENLLGKENQGFKVIMHNFNHERWFIVAGVVAASRRVVEESFKWAVQRKAFGKPLIAQPVIRNKLAHMISRLEALQAWTDNITYQMNTMSYKEQAMYLAGPTALLKLVSTRTALHISDEACQIFGGRAITRTGMGQIVERFQRAIKYGSILGGSEEIMADLGIKQSVKAFPKVGAKL